MQIKRGDIFYADLSPVIGSEQSGVRPILIIQNNVGNKYSPTIIGIPITSKFKSNMPTHIEIPKDKFGLDKNSIILTEQIRTLDKSRLKKKIGVIDKKTMDLVKKALEISCGLRGKLSFEQYLCYINKEKEKIKKNVDLC